MPIGLQVFDATGNVVFDTTMRSGRVFGSVVITGASGFIDVPPVDPNGTPIVLIPKWPRPSQAGQFGEAFFGGNVTFNGTRISWNFSGGGGPAENTTVYYGAF
jgi:hypothetical protein